MQISIQINSAPVQALLTRLAQAGNNLQPVMEALAEDLYDRTDARFDTQTDPAGRAWAPLAPATRKKKTGTHILTESGRLRAGLYRAATAAAAELGANQPYAAIHQWGGIVRTRSKGKGKATTQMPARPYLPVHADGTLYPAEEASVIDTLNRWLAGQVGA